MTADNGPMPVELLRDQRGIYGIGVSDLFDFEAMAWSCGIEPEPYTFERPPTALILRPDRLPDTTPRGAVLQKIAGGFRRGPFMRTHEERLRQFIHHEALNRAGLPWPPRNDHRICAWWSADKKQQARNRGIYHGLRQFSLHVVNHLIGSGARGSGRCRRRQGGAALYVRAPREHLPRRRAQPSRPSIDRDVPGSGARDLRGALASPQVWRAAVEPSDTERFQAGTRSRRTEPPQNRGDQSRRSRRPPARRRRRDGYSDGAAPYQAGRGALSDRGALQHPGLLTLHAGHGAERADLVARRAVGAQQGERRIRRMGREACAANSRKPQPRRRRPWRYR